MYLLRRILKHILSRKGKRLEPSPKDITSKFPPEIWQIIAREHLPLESAASLALTNRYMLYIIGEQYWVAMNHEQNKPKKLRFLSAHWFDLLLPDHYLCHACTKYHLRSRLDERFEAHQTGPACNMLDRVRVGTQLYVPYHVLQLMTRAQRCGPEYGMPIQELNIWGNGGYGWEYSMWPAYVRGKLLIRIINSIRVDLETTFEDIRGPGQDWTLGWNIAKCNHMDNNAFDVNSRCVLGHFRERTMDNTQSTCDLCEPVLPCRVCGAEYMTRILRNSSDSESDTYFGIIYWLDLGRGIPSERLEWDAIKTPAAPIVAPAGQQVAVPFIGNRVAERFEEFAWWQQAGITAKHPISDHTATRLFMEAEDEEYPPPEESMGLRRQVIAIQQTGGNAEAQALMPLRKSIRIA